MKTNVHFWSYLARFFVEWKMFQTKILEKIKTHILPPVTFFFWIRAVYEIMWKNFVEPARPHITIWRMRIACWITKATDTHSEYIILIASLVARTRLNVTFICTLPVLYIEYSQWEVIRRFCLEQLWSLLDYFNIMLMSEGEGTVSTQKRVKKTCLKKTSVVAFGFHYIWHYFQTPVDVACCYL